MSLKAGFHVGVGTCAGRHTLLSRTCRWVPGSARIVVLGAHVRGSGALQVFVLHIAPCTALWATLASCKRKNHNQPIPSVSSWTCNFPEQRR